MQDSKNTESVWKWRSLWGRQRGDTQDTREQWHYHKITDGMNWQHLNYSVRIPDMEDLSLLGAKYFEE